MRPFSGRETGIGTMVTPRYAGTKVRIMGCLSLSLVEKRIPRWWVVHEKIRDAC